MSYKRNMERFAEDMAKNRKNIFLILKITVVLVALSLVATTAFLVVDLAADSQRQPSEDDDGSGAPTVRLKSGDAIYMDYGSNVSWKDKVVYTEGCTIKIDQKNVNKDVPGKYTVRYTVTNTEGRSSYLDVTVYVTKQEYSYATLMSLVEAKAKKLGITSSMTKRQKIEKVYEHINTDQGIIFEDESNTPNINRAKWETDWIEEATRTLNLELDGKTVKGDCYSYYSVSKAFFEYFGIENVGIQRDNSNIDSKYGTHFWLMVNIGAEGGAGQWYYFDATRLKHTFADGTHNACLITLKKLQSYDKDGNLEYNFYAFNPSKYPTASTVELN